VTEDELVARVIARDPLAERALYDAHVDRVYRLAYRLTGDDDYARDVTQETFVRAFDRIATFRHDAALSTWLHRITVSVGLNHVRKIKRDHTRETPLDAVAEPAAPGRVAEPDLKERMAAAIKALPTGYRTVFVLHDVEDFTHEEIATSLGIDIGTSKAQLFRARRKLRAALADFAGEWCS
jgi:RNA polymerase sigma-70 factor (ECF subfamily)